MNEGLNLVTLWCLRRSTGEAFALWLLALLIDITLIAFTRGGETAAGTAIVAWFGALFYIACYLPDRVAVAD